MRGAKGAFESPDKKLNNFKTVQSITTKLSEFPKIYLGWIIDSKLIREGEKQAKVFNSITSTLIPSRIGI